MSGFFEWAKELPDTAKTSFHEEETLSLKDKLMSLRAKRRTLDYKWSEIAFQMRVIEDDLHKTMNAEEKIEDELDRRRK